MSDPSPLVFEICTDDRSVSRARTRPVGERRPGGSWRGEYGSGVCRGAEASVTAECCAHQRL